MRILRTVFALSLAALGAIASAQLARAGVNETTVVNSTPALAKLKANGGVTLQWISWDYRGKLAVTDENGLIRLSGGQNSPDGKKTLKIDGVVTRIDAKSFDFQGEVMYFDPEVVSKPCVRNGTLTFKITRNRQYWRMMEMTAGCGSPLVVGGQTIPGNNTDYVDIYF